MQILSQQHKEKLFMKVWKYLVILSFAFVNGCALTTESIDLNYQPQGNYLRSTNVSVNVKTHDNRTDKSKIGSKKNGFGIETAPILPKEKIEITVQKAIEDELKSRGYLVKNDADIFIHASVVRFYNEFHLGFFSGDSVSDFEMLVAVKKKNGSTVFSKPIKSIGNENNIQIMSAENAQLALNDALKKGLIMLFNDMEFLSSLNEEE